jgi:excisionase family DNA binding protein
MDSEPLERLIGLNEAGRLLGLSYWTLREMTRDGRLPFVRIGRRLMVSESQLRRFVQEAKGVPCA